MTVTFGEAKRRLAAFASAFGGGVGNVINEAVEELAKTESWAELTRVVRVTVSGEYFSLPQDCGRIIRASGDVRPVRIVGSDVEFLGGGPGNYDNLSRGLAPLYGIQALGVFPTQYQVAAPSRLCAFSTEPPSGDIRARIRTADGDLADVTVPCTTWSGTADADTVVVAGISATAVDAYDVVSVTLPTDAEAYVSLYAIADSALRFLSRMHPRVRIPRFHRYRVPGAGADDEISLLLEVGVDPVPLVEDDEPLPFPSLRPVQFMIQSMRLADSGEVDESLKWQRMAEMAMMRREDVDRRRQGLRILNPLEDGSNGAVSIAWENV